MRDYHITFNPLNQLLHVLGLSLFVPKGKKKH